MRIQLKNGKQKELILEAKKEKTWDKLAKELGLSARYLRIELLNEERILAGDIFSILEKISGHDYKQFIIKRFSNNWGQIKGGLKSSGNIKLFKEPKESIDLAELFGIILGDGHVEEIKRGKIRCYSLRIVGDSRDDYDYIINYISSLFQKLFGENGSIAKLENRNVIHITIYGKNLINFLKKKGLKPGNKKLNNQGVPSWIRKNKSYLKACIRGLIDTDGSIHYISKNNRNIRIDFTSHIPRLLNEVRVLFIKLGFHPSKIINNKHIFLSRKEDFVNYLKTIGFSNEKHLNRLNLLKQDAPVIQRSNSICVKNK